MNIEAQVKRELRRVAFWRCMTAICLFPHNFIHATARLLTEVARPFEALGDACFYHEADAARRYRTLTGVDLGLAANGNLNRYGGTNPKALAIAEKDEFGDDRDDDDD